jgi:hypothetical protein
MSRLVVRDEQNNRTPECSFVLLLENVMFCVLSCLRRFLNSGVLRLASKLLAAKAFCSPSRIWTLESGGWKATALEVRDVKQFAGRSGADRRGIGVVRILPQGTVAHSRDEIRLAVGTVFAKSRALSIL